MHACCSHFVAGEKYKDTGECSELVVFKAVLKEELYLKFWLRTAKILISDK